VSPEPIRISSASRYGREYERPSNRRRSSEESAKTAGPLAEKILPAGRSRMLRPLVVRSEYVRPGRKYRLGLRIVLDQCAFRPPAKAFTSRPSLCQQMTKDGSATKGAYSPPFAYVTQPGSSASTSHRSRRNRKSSDV